MRNFLNLKFNTSNFLKSITYMVVLVEKVEQIFDNDNNKWQRLIDKLILADDDD